MALISTTDELKKYVSVDADMEISSLLPDIEWAEEEFIVPYLGTAQYEELRNAYNSPGTPNAELNALLDRVQLALANLALSQYVDIGQVNISDAGVRIHTDSSNKTAFAWQIEKLRAYLLRKGYDALEKLLVFLEENRASYPLWASSTAYSQFKDLLINSATEFSVIYSIAGSRRTYLALVPIMRQIEQTTISRAVSLELLDAIKAELATGTVSADTRQLLRYLQPVVAHFAIEEAISVLPLEITAFGIVVNELLTSEGATKRLAPDGLLHLRMKNAHQIAVQYLNEAVAFLNRSASETRYAAYYNSPLYPKTSPSRPENPKIYGAF